MQTCGPTYQDDFLDFFGRAPVKHPRRVVPLHIHVHVLNLFISRNKEGVMSAKNGLHLHKKMNWQDFFKTMD